MRPSSIRSPRAAECHRDSHRCDRRQERGSRSVSLAPAPVDHVVLTAAQLKTGPFKSVAMEDVAAPWKEKFWGPGVSARGRDPTSRPTLVTGFLSVRRARTRRSSARRTARWNHRPRAGAGTCAGACQRGLTRRDRYADPRGNARGGAQGDAGKTAAALPGRPASAWPTTSPQQILSFMANGFATGSIVYVDGGALVN